MDGMHDLGGRQGFGRVPNEETPKFAHPWEERVFGLVEILVGEGYFNVDEFRHAVERVEPKLYLTAGYYGRWFAALEILLSECGALAGREAACKPGPAAGALSDAATALIARARRSDGLRRQLEQRPRFRLGETVRTRRLLRDGHCRLPAYARERTGVVVQVHPPYVFPDTNAHRLGEHPQYVYSVSFAAEELWGAGAEAGTRVVLDLFETYLEGGGADPAALPPPTRAPQR